MLGFFKKHWWGISFGVMLSGYVAFTLLDAFVIPKEIVPIESYYDAKSHSEDNGNNNDDNSVITTDTSYISNDISINISTVRVSDTQVYVADIVVSDISFLHAGLANGVFGRNVTDTTSEIAKDCNAILAINGDFYGFRDSGPVIRNGCLYRSSVRSSSDEDLAIYSNGNMVILKEKDIDTSKLLSDGVLQLFSFGPGLINNGQISISEGQEVEQSMKSNPRTAMGMISPLHYVFVVSDGRTSESAGLSLNELAGFMKELGCTIAYNLDGGGSSTMWFMGKIVNNPTTNGRTISERKVSDIVYIR
ncbi:MAG: phosphodiester glycosidase family protein [Lachnospira sp.]